MNILNFTIHFCKENRGRVGVCVKEVEGGREKKEDR